MAKRNKEDRQGRAAGKVDKHQAKADGKVQKMAGKADLARAKATKRKWLFFLICALIAGYLIIVKGGGLGVIQKLIPK
tara:strand:+ start:2482 stop:2715 length:234 start_codon:yes stop_codon:yes gene_type:complete